MDSLDGSAPAEVAGFQNIVAFVKNVFSVKPTYTSDEEDAFPVRLVEFRPAWALHALLRFRGISYVNENLPIPVSMGQNLPLVVDGHHILNECEAFNHYGLGGESSQLEENKSLVIQLEELGTLLHDIKYLYNREDITEIKRALGPCYPTFWELQIQEYANEIYSSKSTMRRDLSSLDYSELLTRLQTALGDFDSILAENDGYLFRQSERVESIESNMVKCGSSNDNRLKPRYDTSDAILFGRVCDILCSSFASIVNSRDCPHIIAFTISIFYSYFEMEIVPPSIDIDCALKRKKHNQKKVIEWRRSSDLILQNAFVAAMPEYCLIPTLLRQKSRFSTSSERSDQAWYRLMALTQPSTYETTETDPETDRSVSRWVRVRLSADSLIARMIRGAFTSREDMKAAEELEAFHRDKEGTITVHLGGLIFLSAVGCSFLGYLSVAWGMSHGLVLPSRLVKS